jgi:thioredoxin reductase/polyferredoxin
MRWLHTRWPAGHVEKLPTVREDGSTAVPGLYIVGDLTGVPLLKFSSDTGARAVQTILADPSFQQRKQAERDGEPVLDVVVIGAGVSGVAAAIEAKKAGLSYKLLEATELFSTVVNFPKGKPIFTYPTDMTPAGELQFTEQSAFKEGLVEEMQAMVARHGVEITPAGAERVRRSGGLLEVVLRDQSVLKAHRVIVGIGRSGNFRKLGVPGEELDKVYNRLHDPQEFCGKRALVVGGGDSALETAIALASCGCEVTVSYRKDSFSRPKPGNIEKIDALAKDPSAAVNVEEPSSERVTTAAGPFIHPPDHQGSVRLVLPSKVKEIRESDVVIETDEGEEAIPNDVVFSMIGREPPLEFFRRSGIPITGEWRPSSYAGLALFFLFCVWMYHWKGYGWTQSLVNPGAWMDALASQLGAFSNPRHLLGVLKNAYSQPWVYYTTAYAACVVIFGIRRIRRRKTPYVRLQTLTLMAIQVVPLFILPCILLPWAYHNGWFNNPAGTWIMAEFFPGGPGDFWRAFGLILAWPLFVWNVFSEQPMWGWLVISLIQTFVIIPYIVLRWGKGAYCGWICSCGALAETLGDAHRHKMPHGPIWNRVNMLGQAVLAFAFVILIVRVLGWALPGSFFGSAYKALSAGIPVVNYKYLVDLWLAGVLGVALYFHFSGRVWCRFACPLAALMHIYARFSRFRIFADKKKCISCNVCTSVCHQGIDIMNFANKGLPMEDPECVRCSACVQSCPTGVLSFGEIDLRSGKPLRLDTLVASPIQARERK